MGDPGTLKPLSKWQGRSAGLLGLLFVLNAVIQVAGRLIVRPIESEFARGALSTVLMASTVLSWVGPPLFAWFWVRRDPTALRIAAGSVMGLLALGGMIAYCLMVTSAVRIELHDWHVSMLVVLDSLTNLLPLYLLITGMPRTRASTLAKCGALLMVAHVADWFTGHIVSFPAWMSPAIRWIPALAFAFAAASCGAAFLVWRGDCRVPHASPNGSKHGTPIPPDSSASSAPPR